MTSIASLAERPRTDFRSTAEMIAAWAPREPVLCVFPRRLQDAVERFRRGFPGRTLYAVKVNPLPEVLRALAAAGVDGYDTASLNEIALVHTLLPEARCFYMTPVRVRGTAADAFRHYGVRDFAVDCDEELNALCAVVAGARNVTFYVRLATPGPGAMFELSSKFGTTPQEAARLLDQVAAAGIKPALTFHVGSQCETPAAYERALDLVGETLALTRVRLTALDVGGGFPAPYPGSAVPPLDHYFAAIAAGCARLGLPASCALYCEPGRALVADGLSLLTQVILRKGDKLYLNEGAYGTLMEERLPGSAIRYPTRVFRRASQGTVAVLSQAPRPFTIYGPSCDAYDVLPHPYELPADIRTGDFVEFGMIGAYSAAMRTRFNGFYADTVVTISDDTPPLR